MLLVTGGAGFIGSNFVLSTIAETGETVVNLDQADLRGQPAQPRFVARRPAARLCAGRHLRPRRRQACASQAPARAVVHFAAESHVDRSIAGPAAFVQTNVVGTFCLLEESRSFHESLAARSARVSASCTSRPTRFTDRLARMTRRLPRRTGTPPIAPTPHPRPPPTTWCARTITPTACLRSHELLQQLRPVPVSREAHPAHDRNALAGNRCRSTARQERARLAVRARSLRRGPAGARGGRIGKPTTSAGIARSSTTRSSRPSAIFSRRRCRARRASTRPHHLRERPAGPRQALCDRRHQDQARAGLGAAGELRLRHPQERALVPR